MGLQRCYALGNRRLIASSRGIVGHGVAMRKLGPDLPNAFRLKTFILMHFCPSPSIKTTENALQLQNST